MWWRIYSYRGKITNKTNVNYKYHKIKLILNKCLIYLLYSYFYQAALDFSNNYILGGDNNAKAIERSRLNFAVLPKIYKSDLILWSAGNLPFKDSYVDAFITDMVYYVSLNNYNHSVIDYELNCV